MSTTKERLQEVLDYVGMNPPQLANRLGIKNRQTLYAILKGITKSLSDEIAGKIADAFPGINKVWLLTGEGEMLGDSVSIPKGAKSCKYLKVISLDSVGGMDTSNLNNGEAYLERMLPVADGLDDDVVIHQSGKSMSPVIPPGALLQIRRVDGWEQFFGYGSVFVLLLKDGRRITKKVVKHPTDPKDKVVCVSYNPDIGDEELPKSHIEGVWRVIRVIIEEGW